MTELPTQLSPELKGAQSAQTIAELQSRLADVAAEQETLSQELQRLRQRLSQLSEIRRQYQDQLEKLKTQSVLRNEAEAAYAALASGYDAIRQRFAEIQALRNKSARLLDEQPKLKKEISEYRQFEKEREQLDSLPESYRQTILAHHQDLKKRLEPWWAMRQAEEKLQQKQLTLPVILVPLTDESQINWIIPLPFEQEQFPESIAAILDEFLEVVLNAILRISRHPDWFFAGMDETPLNWQSCWTMVTLMEYEGEIAIVDSAQTQISKHLATRLAESEFRQLKRLQFDVDLIALSSEAWKWSQTVSFVEKDASDFEETAAPLSERSQGWYKDEDIISWERPLNTAGDSLWNEQARRLRTMLINLVAAGKVGGAAVDAALLWQPLPTPHASAVHKGIKALLTHDILDEVSNGRITINPTKMEQVQNLINRQVNEFWRQVIELID